MTTDPSGAPRVSTARWMVPVVVVVLGAAVVAGLLARQIYVPPETDADAVAVPPAAVSSVPPAGRPGDPVVRVAWDAATHPDHQAVLALFQRYVDAINARRFDLWRSTMASTAPSRLPTEAKWRSDLDTTQDGSAVIQRIDPAPGGNLRVFLTFVSTQNPQKAPPEFPEACIRWHVVYQLVREQNSLKIDLAREPSSPQHDRC